MAKRIFLSITAVWVAVLLAASVIFLVLLRQNSDRICLEELTSELTDLSFAAEEGGDGFLNSLRVRAGIRLLCYSPEGVLSLDRGDSTIPIPDITDIMESAKRNGIADESGKAEGKRVFCAAKTLTDGSVLLLLRRPVSYATLLRDLPGLLTAVLLFAILLSWILTVTVTARIAKPLTEFNPAAPESLRLYPEFRPMANRMLFQNRLIAMQMEELKRKRTEFSAITDHMNEGLIILNTKAEILSCNASAKRLLAIPDDARLTGVLNLNRSEGFRKIVREAMVGTYGKMTFTSDEGASYRMLASPVLNDGTPDGAVILILDETEKEQREALRREFTSNISHELKTPLTSISGFAELIAAGAAGENAVHFADNIRREAARLLTLVNDILRLSQLDEGRAPYDPTPIDLFATAEAVATRFRPMAEQHSIALSVSGESLLLTGNQRVLDEMLSNLIDNALKYGRDGGVCAVSVCRRGERIALSVADDGIGIPQDQLDRVFERFYRVDKSHSKEIGGTGLGLSIVKHGALYHHADVDIKSAPGVGTTVTVLF